MTYLYPRPQYVQNFVVAVGEDDVASVVELQDHVIGGVIGAELHVHDSVDAQLLHTLYPLVVQMFSTGKSKISQLGSNSLLILIILILNHEFT